MLSLKVAQKKKDLHCLFAVYGPVYVYMDPGVKILRVEETDEDLGGGKKGL